MNKYSFISKSVKNYDVKVMMEKENDTLSVVTDFMPHDESIKLNGTKVPSKVVLAMLGGKWPFYSNGGCTFCWDAVDHFEMFDGELVPCDCCGGFIPAPNLRLTISDF